MVDCGFSSPSEKPDGELGGLLVSGNELEDFGLHDVGNVPYKNKIGEVVITKINHIPKYPKKEVRTAGWHTLWGQRTEIKNEICW